MSGRTCPRGEMSGRENTFERGNVKGNSQLYYTKYVLVQLSLPLRIEFNIKNTRNSAVRATASKPLALYITFGGHTHRDLDFLRHINTLTYLLTQTDNKHSYSVTLLKTIPAREWD